MIMKEKFNGKLSVAQTVRLSAIFILFLLMLYFGRQKSLWSDDLATIYFSASDMDFISAIRRMLKDAGSVPPLFYVFAHFWMKISPYGTIWLKLPSICFSCIGIWLCGSIAKNIQGERASVVATLFAASSHFLARFAAFTFRAYGLLFLICALTIIAYQKKFEAPNKVSTQMLYGLSLAALVYTNYFGVIVLGILGLCDLCLVLKNKSKAVNLLPYFCPVVLFVPLIICVFDSMSSRIANFWPASPNFANLLSLVKEIASGQWMSLSLFASAAAVLFFVKFCEEKERTRQLLFKNSSSEIIMTICALWFVLLIAIVYVYSHYVNPKGSLFVTRYFTIVLVPFIVAVSVAFDWCMEILFAILDGGISCAVKKTISVIAVSACFAAPCYNWLEVIDKNPGGGQ